jgi:hypothetical protein
MKFSIVIPQLFYDLIARILPGFFFLVLVILSIPELTRYFSTLVNTGGDNFIDSLGEGFGCIAVCYFFGWLFFAFTWGSKRDAMRKKHAEANNCEPKDLDEWYQRIRLAHPPAGFRIVKLRAEARMFEATRTAMLAVILLTLAYVLILARLSSYSTDSAFWVRPLIGVFIASVALYGFHKCEGRAWDYYWGNICSIYNILRPNRFTENN